jgi:hypothetical protein
MFYEAGQRHAMWRSEFAYGQAAAIERLDDAAAGAIGQCRKNHIERVI